jgi:hypothetical protein
MDTAPASVRRAPFFVHIPSRQGRVDGRIFRLLPAGRLLFRTRQEKRLMDISGLCFIRHGFVQQQKTPECLIQGCKINNPNMSIFGFKTRSCFIRTGLIFIKSTLHCIVMLWILAIFAATEKTGSV